MSVTKCKYCAARNVAWQKTGDGKWLMVDVEYSATSEPTILGAHRARCAQRQAAQAKLATVSAYKSLDAAERRAALRELTRAARANVLTLS